MSRYSRVPEEKDIADVESGVGDEQALTDELLGSTEIRVQGQRSAFADSAGYRFVRRRRVLVIAAVVVLSGVAALYTLGRGGPSTSGTGMPASAEVGLAKPAHDAPIDTHTWKFNPFNRPLPEWLKKKPWGGAQTSAAPTGKYYHSDTLPVGTWDPDAPVAENPLDPEGKLGDIPFAELEEPAETPKAPTPLWASGDSAAWMSKHLSNGTNDFQPSVLLISLGGVSPVHLTEENMPNLWALGAKGLRAEYMRPSFPAQNYPNHWSMLTGLYPSAHGIVSENFYAPDRKMEFHVRDEPGISDDSAWWGGEPVWSTAVANGIRVANYMMPGPWRSQQGNKYHYHQVFQSQVPYKKKVAQLMEWVDLPDNLRPRFFEFYAPEVDEAARAYGPNSTELWSAVSGVDKMVASINRELRSRNLTDIIDIVVVSDRGQLDTNSLRVIRIDDIIGIENYNQIEHEEGWPLLGIRFSKLVNSGILLDKLLIGAFRLSHTFSVYTEKTMPKRWHYTGNSRIPPILAVPSRDWVLTTRGDFDGRMQGDYSPKALDAYDNAIPEMQSIFVTKGPYADSVRARIQSRLANGPKHEKATVEQLSLRSAFENVQLYHLFADILQIPKKLRPATNSSPSFWDVYE